MGRLDGKVAFITGAARGQGRAHALALAEEGATIVAVDFDDRIATVPYELASADDLAKTVDAVRAKGRDALGLRADVRSGAELETAVESATRAFDTIDILVANAGIWSVARMHEMSREAWQDVVDVNLTGTWETLRAVMPAMLARRRGAIVLVSSANGLEGATSYAHYVAAKHGVIGLMKAAALEYGPHGIRVNAVCPGAIRTRMNDNPAAYQMSGGGSSARPEDHARAAHHWALLPRRGLLEPESVSAAVVWLVSEESRDVTGLAVPIDGGHMVLPGINGNPTFGP